MAFALAMALVLAAAGSFIFLRLRADLDDLLNANLDARADAVVAWVDAGGAASRQSSVPIGITVPEETFAQVVAGGKTVASGELRRAPVLTTEELRRAAEEPLRVERLLPGLEGTIRILARPLARPEGTSVIVVGQSADDRDEALAGVVRSFAIGGPLAIAIASLLGYLLATAGFRPIEAMRRRAGEIALAGQEDGLPLPAARDEVRRLGETLNEMLTRLRASFERERQFVADASHELRTPIAVVKTEIEGALRSGDYGPGVREALVAAAEECDSLTQLAEDLLVLARAGEQGLPVHREWVSSRALLDGVRERFADRARDHGRTIAVQVEGDHEVAVDLLRARQALGNLVDNALRHGGGAIELVSRPVDGGVEILVSDDGDGFPEGVRDRAFERFVRDDRARASGGAGLGLSIVQAIIEAHGGVISIEPGTGAQVRLWLPTMPSASSQGDLSSQP